MDGGVLGRVVVMVPVAAGETFAYLGGKPIGNYSSGHVPVRVSVSELR